MGLLGEGRLIAGVDKGLRDMCVSERRTVTVPPHLAYGNTGAGKLAPLRSVAAEGGIVNILLRLYFSSR